MPFTQPLGDVLWVNGGNCLPLWRDTIFSRSGDWFKFNLRLSVAWQKRLSFSHFVDFLFVDSSVRVLVGARTCCRHTVRHRRCAAVGIAARSTL